MKSQVVPVVLGGYLAPIQFGYEPLDEKKKIPNYTGEYLKVLQRPMKPGLIEFISTVIIGTMGYGKTELAKWVAVKVSKFYGAENVNAIMNRSADLEVLLEAMDDKPVQLLFLDDSFGEMPEDIAKQFTLIRHRFKAVLEEAGKPETGVIIALFGIQDIYTLDKLARRVSTATIAKSSSGDQWYKNSLKQAFGEDGVRELDRITRKVTRNYDQDIKGRSVITITGYEKTGYIENEMVDENLYTEILSSEKEEEAGSEPSSPRVSNETRFTYDISGDFVTNVQRYIHAKMPDHGEVCSLIYPWIIQKKPASHIMAIYPDMGAERTLYRRISELMEFLHSGEAARDIGLEIFEPWFRKTMSDRGHHVTSSESTARGGIDAMVDGVVHSLKCYHQNRNTVTIPLTEISADELEAAKLKGRLVVVLLNPFWGTNPRYKELTLEELASLDKITVTPGDPQLEAAAEASQPHTRAEPGEDETQTETTDEGRGSDAPHAGQTQATAEAEPAEAEPQAGQAAQGRGVETGEEWPDPSLLEPVAYFKAMEPILASPAA